MTRSNGLPANVTEYQDAYGTWYLRFRKKGFKTYYFKSRPGTEAFRAELEACRRGDIPALEQAPIGKSRERAGTLSALIALYYQTPGFTGLAESSRKTYRAVLENLREAHGDKPVAGIERKHVKAIIGAMHATPQAAIRFAEAVRRELALLKAEAA